ncbi:MAG: BMP family ABC transporter substrate-binding protein [Anaerolineales bacterium]
MTRFSLLILFFALTLSACTPRPQDCAKADVFCVGLVTASGTIHEDINQEAWLGLKDAKSEGFADRIDYIETIDSRDIAKNIAVFSNQGYDIIVTAGFSMGDDTVVAAQQYPHSKFIGVEQIQTTKLPNLVELVFHEDQAGFLAGALAALISQTDRVGAVCESKFVDSIRRTCDGFQAGVRYADSKTAANVVYRDGPIEGLFNDPQWGSATALQLVNDGADVILAAGGETANAALETAGGQGIPVIGSETDVYAGLADLRPMVVTSAVDDIRSGVRELTRLARAGQFPPGEFFGQIGLAPFHDWDRQVPENVKEQLTSIQQGLRDGSIHSGVPYISP